MTEERRQQRHANFRRQREAHLRVCEGSTAPGDLYLDEMYRRRAARTRRHAEEVQQREGASPTIISRKRMLEAHLLFRLQLPPELGGGFLFDPSQGPPELLDRALRYEHYLARVRTWGAEHAEECAALARERYTKNSERRIAAAHAWREANADWVKRRSQMKRMRDFSIARSAGLYSLGLSSAASAMFTNSRDMRVRLGKGVK